MVPIRKRDGTGLDAKGYSQVRKGDGTVLWNAIPDSVLNNMDLVYWMDEGSGSSLGDSAGSNSGTLFGAGWGTETSSPTDKDDITTYDGTDDIGYSDSTGFFNSSQASFGMWIYPESWDANTYFLQGSDNQTGFAGNGGAWAVRPTSGTGDNVDLDILAADGDGNGSTAVSVSSVFSQNTWLFVAATADGDSYEMTVWDDSQELGSNSSTDSTRSTSASAYLTFMGTDGFSRYIQGNSATVMAADSVVSKSTWQSIWDDTRP